MEKYSRRTLISTSVSTGIVCMSGCLFLSNEPGAGALVIRNKRDSGANVMLEIKKTSDEVEMARNHTEAPSQDDDSIWTRDPTFTVEADNRFIKREYITEPGSYFVEAKLDNGNNGSGWVGISRSSEGGISSGYIDIEIDSGENVIVDRGTKV